MPNKSPWATPSLVLQPHSVGSRHVLWQWLHRKQNTHIFPPCSVCTLSCLAASAELSCAPLSYPQVTFVRDLPHIKEETGEAYDLRYRTRAETLLAVDDMIEAVVQVRVYVGNVWVGGGAPAPPRSGLGWPPVGGMRVLELVQAIRGCSNTASDSDGCFACCAVCGTEAGGDRAARQHVYVSLFK